MHVNIYLQSHLIYTTVAQMAETPGYHQLNLNTKDISNKHIKVRLSLINMQQHSCSSVSRCTW